MKGTVEGREGHLVFPDYPGCSNHGTSQMLSLVVAYLLLARSPLIDTIIFNRNQLLDTFDKNICDETKLYKDVCEIMRQKQFVKLLSNSNVSRVVTIFSEGFRN